MGEEVPKGFHRMPDGSIMDDKEMGEYKGSGLQGSNYETYFMSFLNGEYSRHLGYYSNKSREDLGKELKEITEGYNQSVENCSCWIRYTCDCCFKLSLIIWVNSIIAITI